MNEIGKDFDDQYDEVTYLKFVRCRFVYELWWFLTNLTLQKNLLPKSLLVELSCIIFPYKFWQKNKIRITFSFISTHLKKDITAQFFDVYFGALIIKAHKLFFVTYLFSCIIQWEERWCTYIKNAPINNLFDKYKCKLSQLKFCGGSNGGYSLGHLLNKCTDALNIILITTIFFNPIEILFWS